MGAWAYLLWLTSRLCEKQAGRKRIREGML
jgi:hypothetical protein